MGAPALDGAVEEPTAEEREAEANDVAALRQALDAAAAAKVVVSETSRPTLGWPNEPKMPPGAGWVSRNPRHLQLQLHTKARGRAKTLR